MAKKPQKSQTLTVRLDEKTRFAIDFLSRLEGQSVTKILENAILEKANSSYFGRYNTHLERKEYNWRDVWHVSEGVRHLLFVTNPGVQSEIHLTYDEEELAEFAKWHWPFFSTSEYMGRFIPAYVDIIWPHLSALVDEWREAKSTDPWKAGHSMSELLKSANVSPPTWPPKHDDKEESQNGKKTS